MILYVFLADMHETAAKAVHVGTTYYANYREVEGGGLIKSSSLKSIPANDLLFTRRVSISRFVRDR